MSAIQTPARGLPRADFAADQDETFTGPIWPPATTATPAQREAFERETHANRITPAEVACYVAAGVFVILASAAGWLP